MNFLAFDTATNACSVALQIGARRYARHEIAPQKHATLILPMIQAVLSEANVNTADLTAIAFGCGPGSFMGVRLATAIAQGLGFGWRIPLISVSTLQTLAQTAHDLVTTDCVISGWDARMGEIYWGKYALDEHRIMQAQQPDALCAPSMIESNIFSEKTYVFAGNAWSVYAEALTCKPRMLLSDIYPDAKAMLAIAVSKYLHNEVHSPENAHPHYLRHHVVNLP